MFISTDPYRKERFWEHPFFPDTELDMHLDTLSNNYKVYRAMSAVRKAAALRKMADLLERNMDVLADTMTREMGKPIAQSKSEVQKCSELCRWYAEQANHYTEPITKSYEDSAFQIRYESQGIALGIMPWNFPCWQIMRFAVPALAAGNVCAVKPAPNTGKSALLLENYFYEAFDGLTVVKNLFIDVPAIESVIASKYVRTVSLTGSDRAGASVGALSGRYLKKAILELGGSDALLILPDADYSAAIKAFVQARHANNGQTCIAAKRLIMPNEVRQDMINQLVEEVRALTQGDPLKEDTFLSCLAREDIADTLEKQVSDALEKGAEVILSGGRRTETRFDPVIISKVEKGMRAYQEELFGPVSQIYGYNHVDEAVDMVNQVKYGLSCSLWASGRAAADAIIPKLDVGCISVNDIVASDPRVPFGGTKHSGFGRELGQMGLYETTNIKTVKYPPSLI